jgi:hypothetical protein
MQKQSRQCIDQEPKLVQPFPRKWLNYIFGSWLNADLMLTYLFGGQKTGVGFLLS